MRKIQPKIFLDTEIPLIYTLIDGYSIGQVIHFNDTGNEYYHKLDGIWEKIGATSKLPVIVNFIEPGIFDILSTYNIIITNGTNINLWLPLINDVVDGKQLIFKNENTTNTSNILSLDGDAQIENLGNGVPYQLSINSAITLIANKTSNKWDIVSNLDMNGSSNAISNIYLYFSDGVYRYFGVAVSNSSESDSVWTIKRILLNNNGSISTSIATDVKWTDKLTANYI